MKKFHHKKDLPIEESPLTLQLQRRHTVVEGDKDSVPVVNKLKAVSRSNSTSSIYRPPKSAKDLSTQKGYLESTLSSDTSAASTVVITESQLSSSWLYNNKKAQMLSADEMSTQQASDNEEGKSSITPRPRVKSFSSSRSSKGCSSCCCYGSIVILASLAVIGIISTIGGIIYMEVFSGSNKTQAPVSDQPRIGLSEDLVYTKKFGDLGDNQASQDLISGQEISFSSSQPKEPEIRNHFKESNNDNLSKRKGKGSGNILRVKKVKKDVVPATEADASTLVQTAIEQLKEDTDKKHNLPQIDLPSISSKGDSPYSKLFELYKEINANLSKNPSSLEEASKSETEELNSKIINSKPDIPDLTESNTFTQQGENDKHLRLFDGTSDLDGSSDNNLSLMPDLDLNLEVNSTPIEEASQAAISKYFFQMPTKETLDNNEESAIDNSEIQFSVRRFIPVISQISHLKDGSVDQTTDELNVNNQDISLDSKESFNSNLDSNMDASFIPIGEISGPAFPKNFFQMPTKDDGPAFRNMLDFDESSDIYSSEEPAFPRFMPHIPELFLQNDNGDRIISHLNPDNQEFDLPLDLNRPVSEAKIAVPGPLDLIKRFSNGKESESKEDSEMEQHDRRFFLAQALEKLRSLDSGNSLPSSRRKSESKNPEQKLEPKVQNEQEVVTERSNYLQKLRRHFFEQ